MFIKKGIVEIKVLKEGDKLLNGADAVDVFSKSKDAEESEKSQVKADNAKRLEN